MASGMGGQRIGERARWLERIGVRRGGTYWRSGWSAKRPAPCLARFKEAKRDASQTTLYADPLSQRALGFHFGAPMI